MQKIAPSNDTFTCIARKLTLAELTTLSQLSKAHRAQAITYLYTVVFRNPDILLRELSALSVAEMSRFLVKYSDKLNAICNVILSKPGHEDTMSALAIKALIMHIPEYKTIGMTAQKLAEVVSYLEAQGFSGHLMETMRFQQQLIGSLSIGKPDRRGRVFEQGVNQELSIWNLLKTSPNIEFYKNFRSMNFGVRALDLPKKFWWHANLLDADISELSCAGSHLNGAHINYSDASLTFILHNYYVFRFVPGLNYFSMKLDADTLQEVLGHYAEIFSGRASFKYIELRVKQLLYATNQQIYDGFKAAQVASTAFRLIQPLMLKQLMNQIAAIDARGGYQQRLELLNIALKHELFAPLTLSFGMKLKSMFTSNGTVDCRKIITDEIARCEAADVARDNRMRLSV